MDTEKGIIYVLIAILLVLICALFFGCKSNPTLNKACEEMNKVYTKLEKGIPVAQKAHEDDPNVVTAQNLEDYLRLVNTVEKLKNSVCFINELIPIRRERVGINK